MSKKKNLNRQGLCWLLMTISLTYLSFYLSSVDSWAAWPTIMVTIFSGMVFWGICDDYEKLKDGE